MSDAADGPEPGPEPGPEQGPSASSAVESSGSSWSSARRFVESLGRRVLDR